MSTKSKAYFAGGCFWGVEYYYTHTKGVISVISGYMGGHLENPTYQDVCSGTSGHLEVVEVTYDPQKASYETLGKLFFEIHDPTQVNGQGPDIGEQYVSAVFYNNDKEKLTIQKLINILKEKGYDVVTKLIPASTFWEAENYHQNYYDNKKQEPTCHVLKKKF